ncbi:MAG: SDR family oxidoreductase [Lachnospiraceae bacterium]|nr:SDR family oxidoreductase [Lachnospiraceae bacterium]
MVDVTGKWALITGAARGIGRLAAVFLAERGCNIIAHGRTKEHSEELLKELKALGVEAYAVEAELSNVDAVKKMLEEIDSRGTEVDFVLNNAGMQVAYRTDYLKTPEEDYTKSFLINTVSPMVICYHFLPKMMKKGFGRIVNTTSGIALEPEQAGYSASKAALNKVTIDIGSKLQGTDVMINLTDPGWCRTDLGGPHAPNDPQSALPGVVVGVFVDDKKSGRSFNAGLFYDMTLEEAVAKAESMESPY